jgi:hypothetical protein
MVMLWLGALGVCSDVELPFDGALTRSVLMVILRGKRVVIIGCDFLGTTKTPIDPRYWNGIARTMFISPPIFVPIAFNKY